MIWIIFIVIIAVIFIWLAALYNRLVILRNRVGNAWAQIDVQLKRRHDLIPNLVECVKGYMKHEKSTLEQVVEARDRASAARKQVMDSGGPTEKSLKELIGAESSLKSGLGSIFALAENYPDLKANQNMLQLQEELKSTENKVAFSRQAYNDQVMRYNTAQETFPTNLFAKTFGHKKAGFYELQDEKARDTVKVSF